MLFCWALRACFAKESWRATILLDNSWISDSKSADTFSSSAFLVSNSDFCVLSVDTWDWIVATCACAVSCWEARLLIALSAAAICES